MRVTRAGFGASAAAVLFCFAGLASAQQGAIAGTVLNAQTLAPLAAAQVSVLGTAGLGGLTNAQGSFRINVPAGSYSLSIVLIGYQTQRVDGIRVTAGGTVTVDDVLLVQTVLLLDPIVVSPSRGIEERSSAAPSQVFVTTRSRIEEISPTTPVDYVKGIAGMDVQQTGITQSNTVARGFNNIFSGGLLVLTDNRYARVPSLRVNAYNMIPTTPLDVERVEVVLGPAAALYGPNSANGVMHIITTSPIDKPGTSVAATAGNRSIFQGMFRQAWKFSDRSGLKISGQYFQGSDFETTDPVELAAITPSNPLIGARDFAAERFGGEVRYDLRPWDDSRDGLTLSYGFNQLASSIELTGIGAGQARDWRYQFGQAQFRKSGLFVQGFVNASDAGDTFFLRTGNPVVDKSTVLAAQAQYSRSLGERFELITGFDYSKTNPKTEGTITGSNESADETTEVGGYAHGIFALTDRLDLVGALRVDKHEQLTDPVYSPRLGLVVEPVDGQTLRATYNRAFSTPTTNNLYLDLVAGRVPLSATIGYDVRTFGVPYQTGLTWDDQCAGGVNSYCMYSPFAPGTQLPANGAVLWDQVLVPLALQDPTLSATLPLLGLTPAQFAAIVGSPGPSDLTSILLRFNSENPSIPFLPDPGITEVAPIRPTITTNFELGYQGLIDQKVKISASVYKNLIKDFVGPLRVETPSVFLSGASVAAFVQGRLAGVGVPTAVAAQVAQGLAANAARVPLGTVAPDQRPSSDLILTYRNFGDVDFYGGDLGLEVYATDEFSFDGSFSWVSKECFDFNDDGSCTSTQDIALNAPTNKGSLGARFNDAATGVTAAARVRFSGEFPMNSGVYVGTVESFTVVDLNLAYRVPDYRGLLVSLTVNNVLDNLHREFLGAPEMGALGMLKIQYEFGGN